MMPVRYIDSHCHVQFDQYDSDRDTLIEKMRKECTAGIVVGVDAKSSYEALALVEKNEHLFASVGLHPNYVAQEAWDKNTIEELARNKKVVAIGECGLDYFRPEYVNEEVKRMQSEVLQAHIALAVEVDKPLIIHARPVKGTQDAYHDLIALLAEAKKMHPNLRGDIHFFVGGVEEMRALTSLGFTVSFTAVITFARDYDEVVRATPLESILSETDSPYVAPASRRGKRNDPLAVRDVVAKIAEIRGEDEEKVRQALMQNSIKLFGLKNM